MPRRYYTYLEQYTIYHQASTIGSLVLALGFFLIAGYLIHSFFAGEKASDNPWQGKTLEWTHTQSPPVEHNFDSDPVVTHGPYEFDVIDESMGSKH